MARRETGEARKEKGREREREGEGERGGREGERDSERDEGERESFKLEILNTISMPYLRASNKLEAESEVTDKSTTTAITREARAY